MTEACCASRAAPEKRYDLAVIGAGSAGFSAAIRGAELGARIPLVGHSTIGGICVNIGCVPSKTLIRTTEAMHSARFAHRFAGIDASAQMLDCRCGSLAGSPRPNVGDRLGQCTRNLRPSRR
ncbi:FAD-dependent oxidoreductase [Povalibacter uvarum]|uniref:FAD-dependent oxidoreductase n=1 Tax=Povalibacter uvarum TaxID=732238 RepID=UPI001622858C|nr:FAD-dependent oxidoreductase [Povalibacter uvarum]